MHCFILMLHVILTKRLACQNIHSLPNTTANMAKWKRKLPGEQWYWLRHAGCEKQQAIGQHTTCSPSHYLNQVTARVSEFIVALYNTVTPSKDKNIAYPGPSIKKVDAGWTDCAALSVGPLKIFQTRAENLACKACSEQKQSFSCYQCCSCTRCRAFLII